MADEAVDVRHRKLHPRQDLYHGGIEVRGDEIGDGAAENHAKPYRIDAPAHDPKRIGPEVFAGILDSRRAAIAGAQDDRGSAVAKKADGDQRGLCEFVRSKGWR